MPASNSNSLGTMNKYISSWYSKKPFNKRQPSSRQRKRAKLCQIIMIQRHDKTMKSREQGISINAKNNGYEIIISSKNKDSKQGRKTSLNPIVLPWAEDRDAGFNGFWEHNASSEPNTYEGDELSHRKEGEEEEEEFKGGSKIHSCHFDGDVIFHPE